MALTPTEIDQRLEELWDQRRGIPTIYIPKVQQLAAIAHEIDYNIGVFMANIVQAYGLGRDAREDEAIDLLDMSVDYLQQSPPDKWCVRYYSSYGSVYFKLNIFNLSYEKYLNAHRIAKTTGDPILIANTQASLGLIYSARGEYDKAIEALSYMLDIDNNLLDWHSRFTYYLNISHAYYKVNNGKDALKFAQQALSVAQTDFTRAGAHNNIGAAFILLGDSEQAKIHLNKAIEMRQASGNIREQVIAMIDLADLYISIHNLDEAQAELMSALQLSDSIEDSRNIHDCHQRLYQIYETQKNWGLALYHHKQYHEHDKLLFNEKNDKYIKNLELVHKMQNLRELATRQKQEFDTLNIMKDSLLSSVSHDLKNPISVIELNIYLIKRYLKRDLRDNSPYMRYLDTIDYQLKRMEHLVTDVLDMARFDMGFIPEKETVDLSLLITGACDEFQSQVDQKQITLTCQCDSDLKAHVDVTGIQRVLTNLVSNAIKYASESGHVAVTASVDEEAISIQIKDDGIGIPEDDLPHIFERFYRVDAHQNLSEGTGLGLAIVKCIIEQHEGTIDVESQTDIGTTFTIKIPLK